MALSSQQTTDINKQYDPLRKRAQQQEAANLQGQRDVLARRAAQLGGGPSGALIKQESLASDASGNRLQQANEGIDAQQQAAINQAREIQAQREFQTSERVAGQEYGTKEREGTQAWQLQNVINPQNKIAIAGLTGTYGGKATLAKQTSNAQIKLQQAQFDQLTKQQKFENENNLKTNLLSSVVTLKNSGYTPEQLGGILKSVGFNWDDLGINPDEFFSVQGATAAPAPYQAPAKPASNAKPTEVAGHPGWTRRPDGKIYDENGGYRGHG